MQKPSPSKWLVSGGRCSDLSDLISPPLERSKKAVRPAENAISTFKINSVFFVSAGNKGVVFFFSRCKPRNGCKTARFGVYP